VKAAPAFRSVSGLAINALIALGANGFGALRNVAQDAEKAAQQTGFYGAMNVTNRCGRKF
jgi:hypothetical protein